MNTRKIEICPDNEECCLESFHTRKRHSAATLQYIRSLNAAYHCACVVESEGGASALLLRQFIDRVRREIYGIDLPLMA